MVIFVFVYCFMILLSFYCRFAEQLFYSVAGKLAQTYFYLTDTTAVLFFNKTTKVDRWQNNPYSFASSFFFKAAPLRERILRSN